MELRRHKIINKDDKLGLKFKFCSHRNFDFIGDVIGRRAGVVAGVDALHVLDEQRVAVEQGEPRRVFLGYMDIVAEELEQSEIRIDLCCCF